MSILLKKDRIKISEHFYLDEFIHKDLYLKFGKGSTVYLNKHLVEMVELLRKGFNEDRKAQDRHENEPAPKEIGFILNNWATGGNLKNCGVRYYLNPHKKNSLSRHYFSFCADIHLTGGVSEKELYLHILKYKDYYFEKGLTTIENYNYTEGWVHISIEWRPNAEEIKIINP